VELGHSPAPPAAARGSRSGRCVSARTREGSRRPLPLQPAFACGEWLAGGGEWPGLRLGHLPKAKLHPPLPLLPLLLLLLLLLLLPL